MLFMQKHYPDYLTTYNAGNYPYYAGLSVFQGLLPGVGLHYTMF